MKKLSTDWLTEKHIDFEYKKYVLLAYLQEVHENFERTHLYPFMADLVEHYRNLIIFKESKNAFYDQLPERIIKPDFENFRIVFKKIIEDDTLMQEIENIIDFSIPEFEKQLEEGRKVYELIEEHLSIQTVGLLPLNPMEGYFLLQNGDSKETQVYEFQVSVIENPVSRYRGIYAHHLFSYERNLSNTYESIKSDLLRINKKFPNPATYSIESELTLPLTETLIPVAKRSFIKYLAEKFAA